MIRNGNWHVEVHLVHSNRTTFSAWLVDITPCIILKIPNIVFVTSQVSSMSFAVLGRPCAKKFRKEDPFDIFVFDLTSSSDEESCHDQNSNVTSPNLAPKHPVNRYGTRSKKFQQISTQTFAASEKVTTRQRRAKKSVSVPADPSDLHKKAISTSNFKEASGTDNKTCGYKKTSPSTNTPNRPIKASIEDGIPRPKVAQNVFQVKCCRIRSHLMIFFIMKSIFRP